MDAIKHLHKDLFFVTLNSTYYIGGFDDCVTLAQMFLQESE